MTHNSVACTVRMCDAIDFQVICNYVDGCDNCGSSHLALPGQLFNTPVYVRCLVALKFTFALKGRLESTLYTLQIKLKSQSWVLDIGDRARM